MRKALMAAVAACALIAAGGTGHAQEKLKIGVLATLSGALTSGTFQALAYDELAARDARDRYAHVIGLGHALAVAIDGPARVKAIVQIGPQLDAGVKAARPVASIVGG